MKKIAIACDVKDYLPLSSLVPFQGDLKSLSNEDAHRLREEITTTGFAFPVYVWRSDDDVNYIVGGHQRVRVLQSLVEEGYELDGVPVVFVMADSYKLAKRRVLQDVAQYGRMEKCGLFEFMSEIDLKPVELAAFRMPDINLESFKAEFFDLNPLAKNKVIVGSQEISQESFSTMLHQCPRCGFGFGKGKSSNDS